jgi:hypothetical protein
MPKVTLSHFEAALLFAFFTSIVLGVIAKGAVRERLLYGLKCFGYFLVALFGLGWLMYFGHR